jgi:aminodeoxyfutalosine deaminase
MKKFSAQFIFTNTGPALKRGIITAGDDGTIISVVDTGGYLGEEEGVEFYNGIIIPGFVNCHCHLELSYLKGIIPHGTGLAEFISLIRTSGGAGSEYVKPPALRADNEMYNEGISLCADICNTDSTFDIKKKSRIKYINLLEVFGIDPRKAIHRLDEILKVSGVAESYGLPYQIVPHSAYSVSLTLFRLIREMMELNRVTSIHFMETEAEKMILEKHSGPLMDSYRESGLPEGVPELVRDHAEAVLSEITLSGNLILVHNTFADRNTLELVKKRRNLFWCLCPCSNIYIEDHLPPVNLLNEENCTIVTGTDSLASNSRLSILDEIRTLQDHFPSVSLEDLVQWATINGARALGQEKWFGSVEPGKKPGLILLQDVDIQNMKLLPESCIKRLI